MHKHYVALIICSQKQNKKNEKKKKGKRKPQIKKTNKIETINYHHIQPAV